MSKWQYISLVSIIFDLWTGKFKFFLGSRVTIFYFLSVLSLLTMLGITVTILILKHGPHMSPFFSISFILNLSPTRAVKSPSWLVRFLLFFFVITTSTHLLTGIDWCIFISKSPVFFCLIFWENFLVMYVQFFCMWNNNNNNNNNKEPII